MLNARRNPDALVIRKTTLSDDTQWYNNIVQLLYCRSVLHLQPVSCFLEYTFQKQFTSLKNSAQWPCQHLCQASNVNFRKKQIVRWIKLLLIPGCHHGEEFKCKVTTNYTNYHANLLTVTITLPQ